MKLAISLILKLIKDQVIWEKKATVVKEREKIQVAIKKSWRLYSLYERKALKKVIVPFYVIFDT